MFLRNKKLLILERKFFIVNTWLFIFKNILKADFKVYLLIKKMEMKVI